jgi:hypothetical protein
LDELLLASSAVGADIIEQQALSLDEIFLAQVGSQSAAAEDSQS